MYKKKDWDEHFAGGPKNASTRPLSSLTKGKGSIKKKRMQIVRIRGETEVKG